MTMLPLGRRSFLAAAISALAFGRNVRPHQLYVNEPDWLSIPYEPDQLEIVGAAEDGLTVLPNLDQALVAATQRALGIHLTRDNICNADSIQGGCGLYCVYIWTFPAWKKYRLWNYPEGYPPENWVTYTGKWRQFPVY